MVSKGFALKTRKSGGIRCRREIAACRTHTDTFPGEGAHPGFGSAIKIWGVIGRVSNTFLVFFLHLALEASSHAEADDVSSAWRSAKLFHAGAQAHCRRRLWWEAGWGRGKAQVGELVECVGVFMLSTTLWTSDAIFISRKYQTTTTRHLIMFTEKINKTLIFPSRTTDYSNSAV